MFCNLKIKYYKENKLNEQKLKWMVNEYYLVESFVTLINLFQFVTRLDYINLSNHL